MLFVFSNRATHGEDPVNIKQRFDVFYQTVVNHVDFACEVPCLIRYDETCQGAQMDRGCLRRGIVLTTAMARHGNQFSRLDRAFSNSPAITSGAVCNLLLREEPISVELSLPRETRRFVRMTAVPFAELSFSTLAAWFCQIATRTECCSSPKPLRKREPSLSDLSGPQHQPIQQLR